MSWGGYTGPNGKTGRKEVGRRVSDGRVDSGSMNDKGDGLYEKGDYKRSE